MASSQQILREYLVSLGYKVDADSEKKLDKSMLKTSVNIDRLLKGLVGVTTGAAAMVTLFARSMEQMYYASRKAETTVGNLQAVEYAARQIGMTGDQMRGSIEGMARAIRLNPGLQGLIESFGIQVTGRDKADVAVDLLETLRKMPFYVGSQFAGLFGIDPDSYLLLTQNLEKFKEMAAARKQMAQDAGVDANAAAEAAKDYMTQLREIQEMFGLLKDQASIALLPAFKEVASVTKEMLKDYTTLLRTRSMKDVKDAVVLPLQNLWDRFLDWGGAKGHKKDSGQPWEPIRYPDGPRTQPGEFDGVKDDPESLFKVLEQKYGLPMGLLDKMWAKESGRGKYMLSSAGAQGHFQFMPGTAKEMGVKDPMDLVSSATGAAQYMRKLLDKYGGDQQLALAAYNWGPGNVDKKGIGRAPSETRDYVSSLSGKPLIVQQTTTINVTGQDPATTARYVYEEQGGLNEDLASLLRNQVGAVR